MFICLYVYMFICLYVYMFICLYVYMFCRYKLTSSLLGAPMQKRSEGNMDSFSFKLGTIPLRSNFCRELRVQCFLSIEPSSRTAGNVSTISIFDSFFGILLFGFLGESSFDFNNACNSATCFLRYSISCCCLLVVVISSVFIFNQLISRFGGRG